MSYFFKVEGNIVSPLTETLSIPPFKQIWERDNTPNKERAKQELSYMEFVTSMKKSNPFAGYKEKEKPIEVKRSVFKDEPEWEPDELVEQGMEKIIEFQENASVTYKYYMSAKVGAEKMMDFFNTFDMNDVNIKNGNPVYKPREITSALNDTSKVLNNLNDLKKKVEQELFESVRGKGDKEVGFFAKMESVQ